MVTKNCFQRPSTNQCMVYKASLHEQMHCFPEMSNGEVLYKDRSWNEINKILRLWDIILLLDKVRC